MQSDVQDHPAKKVVEMFNEEGMTDTLNWLESYYAHHGSGRFLEDTQVLPSVLCELLACVMHLIGIVGMWMCKAWPIPYQPLMLFQL